MPLPAPAHPMSDSPKFLHLSLSARLMDDIAHGRWAPGQQLPSVREMSRLRAVSVTTVLAAYRSLEDRQVIESRPQKGFYVCSDALSSDALRPPGPSDASAPLPSRKAATRFRTRR